MRETKVNTALTYRPEPNKSISSHLPQRMPPAVIRAWSPSKLKPVARSEFCVQVKRRFTPKFGYSGELPIEGALTESAGNP